VEIYSRRVARQKLNYIHFNLVSNHWKLSKDDLDFYYSSARFYEKGIDDFGFYLICMRSSMEIENELFRVPRNQAGMEDVIL